MCTLKDICHSCILSLLDQSSSYDFNLNVKPEQQRSVSKVISRSKEHSSATIFISHQYFNSILSKNAKFSTQPGSQSWKLTDFIDLKMRVKLLSLNLWDIILGVMGMFHSFLIFYETNN